MEGGGFAAAWPSRVRKEIGGTLACPLNVPRPVSFKVIEKESVEVEATSKNVRRDEAAANVQAAEAQSLKDECENELAEAIPALEGALRCFGYTQGLLKSL